MKPKKAFTLVEVIVAVALVGMVVVVYLNGIGQGFLMMRSGVDYTISTFDAQKEMEELVKEYKSDFENSPGDKDFSVDVFTGDNKVSVDLKTVKTTDTSNPIYTAFVTSYKLPEALSPSISLFEVGVYTQNTNTLAFPWFEDAIELRANFTQDAIPVIYQNRSRWYISNEAEKEPTYPSGYLVYKETLEDMPPAGAYVDTLVKNSENAPILAEHYYYFEARPFTAEGKIATSINEDRILVLNRNGSELWQNFIEDAYFNRVSKLKTDTYVDVMQNRKWPTLDVDWGKNEDPEGPLVAARIPASLVNKAIRADVNFEIDKKALDSNSTLLGTGIAFVNADNSGYMVTFDVIHNKILIHKLNAGQYEVGAPLKEINLLTDSAFEKFRTNIDGNVVFDWTKSFNSALSFNPDTSKLEFQLQFSNESDEIISSDMISMDLGSNPIVPEFVGFKSFSERDYKPDSQYEIVDKYERNYASHFYNLSLTKLGEEDEDVVDIILNKNVFVYGSELSFQGTEVTGDHSAVFISNKDGALEYANLNGGGRINVSNIYIQGKIDITGGSALLGSQNFPGEIHVNNDVSFGTGTRHIYGDMYINGDFRIGHAIVHGDVFVDGDFGLGTGIGRDLNEFLAMEGHIYYTGNFIESPNEYNTSLTGFPATKVTYVKPVNIPELTMPICHEDQWYADRGYKTDKNVKLSDGIRLFVDDYKTTLGWWKESGKNIVIVAKTGDIEIKGISDRTVTGILFAPNGKVTVDAAGGRFEGLVIARDGFFVPSGGSWVKFLSATTFVDKADVPFRAPIE
ncbi:prepilin-type N-terminal cleavage/methylation domain-containing protein [Fusibacter ferrireducens]|uniref:Prepilin-type N-terminal cleavage/methylation domain-containing protein n=1 Tax=Fusibacter ferrireducens TaxID=2785058 RepID=A0ABR9ZTQ2_9FIRM|nr:prepilin-type N-terminal cleavage/methylation domain-containing protein [Fusibacter ferrireducens]MBF4693847.1 prepilin-type N-terminal cleavage/methylation domain-containing protein [Fusibacter ferrireducens]